MTQPQPARKSSKSKISFKVNKQNETATNREIYIYLLFTFITAFG